MSRFMSKVTLSSRRWIRYKHKPPQNTHTHKVKVLTTQTPLQQGIVIKDRITALKDMQQIKQNEILRFTTTHEDYYMHDDQIIMGTIIPMTINVAG